MSVVDVGPLSPVCFHADAVPVETYDGERVAWLCPNCDGQLRPEWAVNANPFSELFMSEAYRSAVRAEERERELEYRWTMALLLGVPVLAGIFSFIMEVVYRWQI